MKDGKRNFTWLLIGGVASGGRQKSGSRLKQAFQGRGKAAISPGKAWLLWKARDCPAWVSAPSRCSARPSPRRPKGPGCNDHGDTADILLQGAVKVWEGSVSSARLFFFFIIYLKIKSGKSAKQNGKGATERRSQLQRDSALCLFWI